MSTFTKLFASNILGWSLYGGWTSLGLVRGLHAYDYYHRKHKPNGSYLYSEKACFGIFGIVLYVNPMLCFFTIPKEIYRLEVIVRDIKHEKTCDYYNELI